MSTESIGGDMTRDGSYHELRLTSPEQHSPAELLTYLEEHITPEVLVHDRPNLVWLADVLDKHFVQEDRWSIHIGDTSRQANKYFNPHPVLEIHHEADEEQGVGGGTFYERDVFSLRETGVKHYYFVPNGYPSQLVPDFLRPEDVIISGPLHGRFGMSGPEMPFNKSLHRVPKIGGQQQRFSYRTDEWEDITGIYHPAPPKRLHAFLARISSKGLLTKIKVLPTHQRPQLPSQ